MRRAVASCLVPLLGLIIQHPAFADTELTSCGQTVTTGRGFLSADLDCTGSAAKYGVKFDGPGTLDLNGFTLSHADNAIACDGTCIVRNGALASNVTNVAGARVKLTDVSITGGNFGVTAHKGAQLQNVTISGATEAVRCDRGTVKLDTVAIDHGSNAVTTAGTAVAIDTTISDQSRAGITATRVRLVRSSVTGSGSDPDCNTLDGFDFFLCADVLAWKKPGVRASSCATSMVLSSNVNLDDPANWAVCSAD